MTFRRPALRSVAFAAVFALAACSSTTEVDEPEIGSVRLTVDGTVLVITPGGAQGTLTLNAGASSVSATFLDEDGAIMTLDPAEFEIRIIPANTTLLTFLRSTAFTGTLNRLGTGTTTMRVSVFHKDEGHDDFGPHTVSVTLQ